MNSKSQQRTWEQIQQEKHRPEGKAFSNRECLMLVVSAALIAASIVIIAQEVVLRFSEARQTNPKTWKDVPND